MLNQFVRAMKAEGLSDMVIRTFSAYYEALQKGSSGQIPESTIKAPSSEAVIHFEELEAKGSTELLRKIAVIKLNGGLGTSMGLSKAKSLLPVKGNMNFLDIITRHILALRSESGYDIQLMFMNSFATEKDTLAYLNKYPDLSRQDLPISFMQNKFPRILQEDLSVFTHKDKDQRWNPPGHGDIYTAISTSGILEKLIAKGYRYAFVSNSDNLGATVDTSIAAYMEKHDIPFLMEVCERSEMDKKGGHLAQDTSGQLLLREIAQCPAEDLEAFQDINKYRYFNTNNLWIDLKALEWHLITNDGLMLLPLIVNPKEVDGSKVYQLETAMGAAISSFTGARAVIVPRQRFSPVKKTDDLLSVWSDAYELNDQYQIRLKHGMSKPPYIELDPRYYGNIEQMQKRFEAPPSLSGCKELKIEGDVSFGTDVVCDGRVNIKALNPVKISNRLITGDLIYE
ncbi:MAG: UTP--glucose-1-phosphate uridylyltransferase [Candidatus Cloacimonetes bacterium]|jgi:UTP--glucose-1-phosphate uridylyltransferase|nr:UTP--glucose-1-phosphate uridylyltransferase [Candidatus Cloacimonadota bacterium]MDD2422999.1 UTP--glucose-1-phosphate uridylyltransferase [Candidatus Cloacimonadota bacterium]MDD3563416.1 UTP--glucose-1-phosphate uridylyltransferase [Candidatus Cloacimonadota bacterium]MDD4276306.1 UTP--glucose-1-phosphate uridylyltransferase [Candidatus Cloacimonadota bacterium]MDY0325203.1 UTP--glucose-1-phosphate uridylyltransferase [Candidatus Cloacimonadaceae bacterium]